MKRNFNFTRRAASLALTSVFTAAIALAQDAPPSQRPAQVAPEGAQRERGERGERGDRANRGNAQNVQRGGFGGVNFDEKQRQLLQEARQVNADELRKLNGKLDDLQKEYVKLVVAEKSDASVLREKADAIGKVQAEILALNGKAFATVSPTLKPEQREALESNAPFSFSIINAGGRFGGPGGGFLTGPGGGRGEPGFGGGRGGDAGPTAGGRGGREGRGDAGAVPPERGNRRRGGENPGQ